MGDQAFGPHAFKPWSIRINDLDIRTCRFIAKFSALLGQGKEWLAKCQDNVTGWDIGSWCQWPDLRVGWHYKSHHEYSLSQGSTHPDMTIDFARLHNPNKQPASSHHKRMAVGDSTVSNVSANPDVTIDVARMHNPNKQTPSRHHKSEAEGDLYLANTITNRYPS